MATRLLMIAAGLVFALPLAASEPDHRLRIVLVHGADAEQWLTSLGKDCVQLVCLASGPQTDDGWTAVEHRLVPEAIPDAIVVCPFGDDMLSRFWCERLCNQKPIEVLMLMPSHSVDRLEHHRRCLQKTHRLLIKLCPEARTKLDQRLQAELLRCQPLVTTRESFAGR